MSELRQRHHGLESFLRSAPQHRLGAAGVEARILNDLTHVNLRGDANNTQFTATVETALQQRLPIEANTVSSGTHRIYWLGPDEWLIVSGAADAAGLGTGLQYELRELHASVNDISGGQVVLRLAGTGTADLLAKGCTLDFHPDVFKPGDCAQSGLAKTNVIIGRMDPATTFELIVRRSYSEYLASWLQRSARDCGIEFR